MTQSIQINKNNYNVLRQQFIQTLTDIDQIQYSDLFEEFISVFNTVHSKIRRYTKYRNINLAFPPILYMFLKVNAVVINRHIFSQSLDLAYNQLVKDMKNFIPLYPDFKNRDKSRMIFAIIEDVVSYFDLHHHFTDNATLLYNHFYPLLQFTSEELSAGVILVLTLIVSGITSINMAQICERICVSSGSVSNKINKYIIPKLGIPNFQSPINSAYLLREKLVSLMTFHPVPCPSTSLTAPLIERSSLWTKNLNEQSLLLLNIIIERITKKQSNYELLSRSEFLIHRNIKTIRKNIDYFIKLLKRKNIKRDHKRIVGVSIAFACPRASLKAISRLIEVSGSSSLSCLFQKISHKGTFTQYASKFPYLDSHYAKEVFRILKYHIKSLDLDYKFYCIDSKPKTICNSIEKICEIANEIGFRTREPLIVATSIALTDPNLSQNDISQFMTDTLNIHVNHTTFSHCVRLFRVVKLDDQIEKNT